MFVCATIPSKHCSQVVFALHNRGSAMIAQQGWRSLSGATAYSYEQERLTRETDLTERFGHELKTAGRLRLASAARTATPRLSCLIPWSPPSTEACFHKNDFPRKRAKGSSQKRLLLRTFQSYFTCQLYLPTLRKLLHLQLPLPTFPEILHCQFSLPTLQVSSQVLLTSGFTGRPMVLRLI